MKDSIHYVKSICQLTLSFSKAVYINLIFTSQGQDPLISDFFETALLIKKFHFFIDFFVNLPLRTIFYSDISPPLRALSTLVHSGISKFSSRLTTQCHYKHYTKWYFGVKLTTAPAVTPSHLILRTPSQHMLSACNSRQL